jgi:hypothetical protein
MVSSAWGLRRAALALAALGGNAWQLTWPALPPTGGLLAALAGAALLLAWAARTRRLVAGCIGLALAAAALSALRAEARLAGRLDAALEGADIVLTGVIASLPVRSLEGEMSAISVAGTPKLPRRNWRSVAPKSHSCTPCTLFRSGVGDLVLMALLPDVRLVVPCHSALDLFQARISAVNDDLPDYATVPVPLAKLHYHLPAEDEFSEALSRPSAKCLSVLRGVYTSQTDLVLSLCRIQNRDGVAVRQTHDHA